MSEINLKVLEHELSEFLHDHCKVTLDLEAVAEGVFEPSAVFFASDDVIFAASTAARAAFASATIRATLSSVDSDALAASFAASAAEEAPAPPETLC